MSKHKWHFPSPAILPNSNAPLTGGVPDSWLRCVRATILSEFERLGISAKIPGMTIMSSYVNFEVVPGKRTRVSKIMGIAPDLEVALGRSVQVTANNKLLVRVEREERQVVTLRPPAGRLTPYLGQSNDAGGDLHLNIVTSPHILIAGTTGSGKSVCLNTLLVGLLMSNTPDQLRLHLIDPKQVELAAYKDIPHLGGAIITEMDQATRRLAWLTGNMDARYTWLLEHGYRSIDSTPGGAMSRIIVVVEEMADLMLTHREAQYHIIRLVQKGRAAGIHLILVTQRPVVKVVTGLIKTNVPTRIAFRVPTNTESRVILDRVGAEHLLGKGDMLIISPGSDLVRGQCAFTPDSTIHAICEHWREQKPKKKWRLFK